MCIRTRLQPARSTHTSLVIPGKHRKSAASFNRSSSGFKSSHIPPPQHPISPPASTLQNEALLPSIQPTPRRQKNCFTSLNSGKLIARSHSCTDLRRNPAAMPVQRCVSLKALLKEQEGNRPNPKHWDLKTTKSNQGTQHSVNRPPVCRASIPDKDAVFESESRPKEFQQAPEKSSQADSCRDFFLTETTCRHDCANQIAAADNKSRSVSAASEARRLKLKRNLKISTYSVNLGPHVEKQ